MLPNYVLANKVKLIYVCRNPRDAVVSFYNHWRVINGFKGSFDIFFNAFVRDVCGFYTTVPSLSMSLATGTTEMTITRIRI